MVAHGSTNARTAQGAPPHPRPARDAVHGATGDNARMDILLNGDRLPLPDDTTLSALLEAQQLARRRVAVEINGEIVPRSRHAERVLRQGDRVEVVHALGGG